MDSGQSSRGISQVHQPLPGIELRFHICDLAKLLYVIHTFIHVVTAGTEELLTPGNKFLYSSVKEVEHAVA
jgi:hypothetical protein